MVCVCVVREEEGEEGEGEEREEGGGGAGMRRWCLLWSVECGVWVVGCGSDTKKTDDVFVQTGACVHVILGAMSLWT